MSDDESQQEPTAALVAIDFTSDQLWLVLTTPGQDLIANERFPLPALEDEAAWAWEVGGRISTLFARDGQPLYALGIGVSCPGFVDPVSGVITESRAQDGWDDLHIVSAIRRHIDAPTVALDRTQAGLRGEMTLGAAGGHSDALYISVGTDGASAATLVAGTIVRGANHRPGLLPPPDEEGTLDLDRLATWIGDAAALLDTAIVVLNIAEEHADALQTAVHEAAANSGAMAEVVVSELGDSASLYGALDAAGIVAYEGERDE